MKPPKLFSITIDGLGDFEFRWRDMAAHMSIESKISALTGGQSLVSPSAYWLAETTAIFAVLLKSAPDGWDFNALDPTEEETYKQLAAIREAHSKSEATFRGRVPAKAAAGGEGRGEVPAVLVPEAIRAGAD